MPFGGDDAQTTQTGHLLVVFAPLCLQAFKLLLFLTGIQRRIGFDCLYQLADIAAEHNVGASAGHVGGNCDHPGTASLRHDVGLARMLLGVEHLMRQLFFFKQSCNDLGVFNRCGAHQHRLPALMAFADVGNGGLVFLMGGFIDPILLVIAATGLVGRNHHGLQPVNFLELVGFGIGRASHAGQLFVQPEVILESDGCHGLVFWLDRHTLLGLYRLVQAFAPAPPGHQPPGELIDNHHLAGLHHIVLIAVVQVLCPQRRIQMVHQRDVGRVIQAGAFGNQSHFKQDALGVFMTTLGQENLVTFFINGEVARFGNALAGVGVGFALLFFKLWHDQLDALIQIGLVFGLATDDQGRARLVNQNRIHLIDNRVVQAPLHPVCCLIHHVVAQVVKAILVVSAVGDVGPVGSLLFFARHVGQIDADRQPQKVVKLAHPLGISISEVVIYRHHMHALAGQGIQVHRQGGGQGLAFAGAHFGDFSVMQRHAAEQLHIEMAHLHDPLGALAHHRKSLRQQIIQCGALGHALF